MKNVFDRNLDGNVDGLDVQEAGRQLNRAAQETKDSVYGMSADERKALNRVAFAVVILALVAAVVFAVIF